MTKLIYIGGYGRSGSTLLEYLMTSHSEVVACGEVERHLRNFGRKKVCTCGRRVNLCPVWGAFLHKKGRMKDWDHERLTLALREHVSSEYSVMVDSSKTAWGSLFFPFQLSRKLGQDFLLVHIVRDPRGVCWSAMRTEGRPRKAPRNSTRSTRALRAAIGWMAANLACEAFRLRHPESYLSIRYEDLTRSPGKVIRKILDRVSLRLPSKLRHAKPSAGRHQLHGNAMRFGPLSLSKLRQDVAWKAEMPKGYRWFVASFCWPLLRRYKYGRSDQAAMLIRRGADHQEII